MTFNKLYKTSKGGFFMKIRLFISLLLLLMIIVSACTSKTYLTKIPVVKAAINKADKNVAINTTEESAEINKAEESAAVSKSIVIDHSCIALNQIPLEWIENAKKDLHIAYGHTSHGSQVTSGLLELTKFKQSPYIYEKGSKNVSLDLRDNPFEGYLDLGNPDNKTWAAETRKYLNKNKDINVVMWSWCGQLSKANEKYVKQYLDSMQLLETEYPEVTFVYMTGHLNGTGENGTLAKNNMHIREFCITNNKVFFIIA